MILALVGVYCEFKIMGSTTPRWLGEHNVIYPSPQNAQQGFDAAPGYCSEKIGEG